MFRSRLTPNFARQKAELLLETSVPRMDLPASVEACIDSIASPEPPARDMSAWGLWKLVLRWSRPLIGRAAAVALVQSLAAVSATFIGMRLLAPGRELSSLLLLSAAFFGMNCLAQLCAFQGGRLRAWIGLGSEAFLAGLITRKLLRISASAAAAQSSGNLKVLITSDVRNVVQFLDNAIRNLVPASVALVVISPLLVRLSGTAGAVGIGVMALVLPIALGLNRISARYQDLSQTELDALTSMVGEWVKNLRLIRYLSWSDAVRADVSRQVDRFMSYSMAQHFMACLIFGFSQSWWMVSVTGVVVAARALGLPLDLVSFFGSLWLLMFLASYFTHLPNTIRLYGLASPSVARIARLLCETEQEDQLVEPPEGTPVPAAGVRPVALRFEGAGFRYPGGKQALEGLDLRIELSRKLAILGEVGSGKTTFLKLLCGELKPSQGRIVVELDDGTERDLWEKRAYGILRGQVAYVPQEPFVSSDLLSSNITLDAANETPADREAILEAAYWAELEADIALLPKGLSQEIGESGVNLSGGQRQRLNLARAFHSRRSYLVLDDTLSAVDKKTEIALVKRLNSIGRGFALVTHRTGELRGMDEVLVLDGGRAVERGAPGTLASDPSSLYSRVLRAYESGGPAHG
jgi:ABC-type multidrug transport system fused ATPase/permease subunit